MTGIAMRTAITQDSGRQSSQAPGGEHLINTRLKPGGERTPKASQRFQPFFRAPETVETVGRLSRLSSTQLKLGVNGMRSRLHVRASVVECASPLALSVGGGAFPNRIIQTLASCDARAKTVEDYRSPRPRGIRRELEASLPSHHHQFGVLFVLKFE